MLKPEALIFTRVSGAENTFFIVNLFDAQAAQIVSAWSESTKKSWVTKVCESFFGLKTNGVLFLRQEPGYDFGWDFYNSDGSSAEMCGNAARCAIYFYYHQVEKKPELSLKTIAGEIRGKVLGNNWVQVEMTKTFDEKKEFEIEGFGQGYFVNTGVPHFVIERNPDKELAARLRFHPLFGNPGSNITFVKVIGSDKAEAVTYERGVEDFTQACGTGAVAAALYLKSKTPQIQKAKIHMPGGKLIVENLEIGERPLLIGGAQLEVELKAFSSEAK